MIGLVGKESAALLREVLFESAWLGMPWKEHGGGKRIALKFPSGSATLSIMMLYKVLMIMPLLTIKKQQLY